MFGQESFRPECPVLAFGDLTADRQRAGHCSMDYSALLHARGLGPLVFI